MVKPMKARPLLALSLVLGLPAAALAEPRPYRGPHPLDLEGHWHLDESVHVHDDLPVGLAPFAAIDGVMVFLADPLAYGYPGESWAYQGQHPLPARYGALCGLEGEHRHPFSPEGGDYRRSATGTYRFTGALPGGVPTHRPGRVAPPTPVTPPGAYPPSAVYPTPYGYYAPFGFPQCTVVTVDRGGVVTTELVGPGCETVVAPPVRRPPAVRSSPPPPTTPPAVRYPRNRMRGTARPTAPPRPVEPPI
jgi:hypothetical protein